MRVVIIGAGEVGFHLARILSHEHHQVVLVDPDPAKVQRAEASLDVLAIEGSGSSARTLQQAGIKEAELLIAVSAVDEINIVACLLAQKFGVPKTVARVRNEEYTDPAAALKPEQLGIDLFINPELEAAQEIVRLIRRAAATEVVEFAEGAIQLVGLRLDADAPILSQKLRDVSSTLTRLTFRTVAILRNGRTLIPTGEDYFHEGDQIFVVSKTESVPELLRICGKAEEKLERIMILGGGKVGRFLARELEQEKGLDIRLIESNRWKSEYVAAQLSRTLVIQGDGTDVDLMAAEGLIDMDAFVAVTDDEETNLITSLLARHLGVRRTVTMVTQASYLPLMGAIGLDAAVDKRLVTANAIARFVHHKGVLTVAALRGIGAEAIELVAEENAKVVQKPLKQLNFPKGAIIGAVMRNGEVFVPVGDSQIQPRDKVVVFALPRAVDDVEKMFFG